MTWRMLTLCRTKCRRINLFRVCVSKNPSIVFALRCNNSNVVMSMLAVFHWQTLCRVSPLLCRKETWRETRLCFSDNRTIWINSFVATERLIKEDPKKDLGQKNPGFVFVSFFKHRRAEENGDFMLVLHFIGAFTPNTMQVWCENNECCVVCLHLDHHLSVTWCWTSIFFQVFKFKLWLWRRNQL